MQIWDVLEEKPEQREALKRLYKELSGKKFTPPRKHESRVNIDVEMETGDEILKLMSQTRRHFK